MGTIRRKTGGKKHQRGGTRKRQGGYSGIKVPFSPANFQGPSQPVLPPYGPIHVPIPGITEIKNGEYYYAKNNNVVAVPKSTYSTWGKHSQKGGKKYSKKGKYSKKEKYSKKGKYSKKEKRGKRGRHGKRGKQSGGGVINKIVNSIPGGTDLRDAYWNVNHKLGNLWYNWNGYEGTMSPSPSVQPIGKSKSYPTIPYSLSKIYNNAENIVKSKLDSSN